MLAKNRRLIAIIVLVFLLGGISLVLFNKSKKENEPTSLTLTGNVDIRQVDIGFRVLGKVATVLVEEGDEVHAGDLLAELDPAPYEAQRSQYQAAVMSAEKKAENARKVYMRRKALIGLGAVSEEDYINALADYEQLSAGHAEAKASLNLAEVNLADTKIHSPVHSTVLTRIREPGSVLNVGDPVLTLSIFTPVWIRTYVTEPELGLVYFGMPAEVRIDTKGSKVYKGRLGFISPVAEFTPKNVETTTLRPNLVYRLRIIVDDPDHALKRGMPVTITLFRTTQ